ncbi:hypothetical protein M407DRAFT_24894 [Tulasnella calospora MUT 4182]|uniref:Uncharacterized protein n=1 Tax=Tulasnella calospora MUT 4182 TaxID=1051891 RepID=A0A0C3QH15_9AGAM|nr:hypothetical protein M407DRAFT_24894 [Tulasnella calospora MUT 4182]
MSRHISLLRVSWMTELRVIGGLKHLEAHVLSGLSQAKPTMSPFWLNNMGETQEEDTAGYLADALFRNKRGLSAKRAGNKPEKHFSALRIIWVVQTFCVPARLGMRIRPQAPKKLDLVAV